jgi:plastocyanin
MSVPHNVVAGTLAAPGSEYCPLAFQAGFNCSRVFSVVGSFPFYCSVHPSMRGTLVGANLLA